MNGFSFFALILLEQKKTILLTVSRSQYLKPIKGYNDGQIYQINALKAFTIMSNDINHTNQIPVYMSRAIGYP